MQTIIAADAFVTMDDETGRLSITVAGRWFPIADNYDRAEVKDRMHADLRGERGLAFADAARANDQRAMRRTFRMIGV